jgi:hypothetical protein
MQNSVIFLCFGFILITACESDAMSDEDLDTTSRLALAIKDELKVPGFRRQDKSKSPIKLGDDLTERSQGDIRYWDGPLGSFSKNVRLGFSAANTTDKEVINAPPFGNSLEEHNQLVLEKFLESGLPSEQVDRVEGTIELTEVDQPSKDGSNNIVTGYTSFIRRKIDDIPLPDSLIMARYNNRKECLMEMVYWPEIPVAAVEKAKTIKQQREIIRSVLPNKVLKEEKGSHVAIRHKFGATKSTFEAWASYDVTSSKGETRSFDLDGKEIEKDIFK